MELTTSPHFPRVGIGCVSQTYFVSQKCKCSKIDSRMQPQCLSRLSQHCTIKMDANGLAGRDSYKYNRKGERSYQRLGSCLVIPPSNGKKPNGIVIFLGGAFIGAVPEVTYSYLIELLAKEGFVIISVPYSVTFDHAQAAKEIYKKFNSCLDIMFKSGLPNANLMASDLINLPLYSVGHSNGALLQVLTGSYFSKNIPKANIIISYNNKPVTEAVPYFEQLGPLVNQAMPILEASPVYLMASSASRDSWKALLDMARTTIPKYDAEVVASLTNFVDQLPSVFNQVRQGISEFKPSPAENRDFFKNSYNVRSTLLVKFYSDVIDETDLLEETLTPRVKSIGGTLEKVSLDGNHVTPCTQELNWQVGDLYTPSDAVAQAIRHRMLNEIRVLSQTISSWFGKLRKS